MRHASGQRGFTLVELMISLVLSMLAAIGVIGLFSSQHQTFRSTSAISDLQETGRIALDILSRDIRMAGYQGCTRHQPDPNDPNSTSQISLVTAAGTVEYPFRDVAIRGYDTSDPGWADGADADIQRIANLVIAGTDVIAIQFADTQESQPTGDIASNAGTVTLVNGEISSQILNGERFIITDCTKANIVTRTNDPITGGGPLTFDGTLTDSFAADASILKFNNNIYFVGNTARTLPDGTPVSALFLTTGAVDASGAPIVTELMAGVENIQFMYGRDLSGSMQFNSAADVTAAGFSDIVSVNIGVLASSTELVRMDDDATSYTLAGITIASAGAAAHGNDKRMRRRFNTAVNIRNRRTRL